MLSAELEEKQKEVLDYFLARLPNWPEYVVCDWIYPTFKHDPAGLNILLENHVCDLEGIDWQRMNTVLQFQQFDAFTRNSLFAKNSGPSYSANKIEENINELGDLTINTDPIVALGTTSGYRLVSGWQRTANNFRKSVDGFETTLWIGIPLPKKGKEPCE